MGQNESVEAAVNANDETTNSKDPSLQSVLAGPCFSHFLFTCIILLWALIVLIKCLFEDLTSSFSNPLH